MSAAGAGGPPHGKTPNWGYDLSAKLAGLTIGRKKKTNKKDKNRSRISKASNTYRKRPNNNATMKALTKNLARLLRVENNAIKSIKQVETYRPIRHHNYAIECPICHNTGWTSTGIKHMPECPNNGKAEELFWDGTFRVGENGHMAVCPICNATTYKYTLDQMNHLENCPNTYKQPVIG